MTAKIVEFPTRRRTVVVDGQTVEVVSDVQLARRLGCSVEEVWDRHRPVLVIAQEILYDAAEAKEGA